MTAILILIITTFFIFIGLLLLALRHARREARSYKLLAEAFLTHAVLNHPPQGVSVSRLGSPLLYLAEGQGGRHAFYVKEHQGGERRVRFELQRLGPPETTPTNW